MKDSACWATPAVGNYLAGPPAAPSLRAVRPPCWSQCTSLWGWVLGLSGPLPPSPVLERCGCGASSSLTPGPLDHLNGGDHAPQPPFPVVEGVTWCGCVSLPWSGRVTSLWVRGIPSVQGCWPCVVRAAPVLFHPSCHTLDQDPTLHQRRNHHAHTPVGVVLWCPECGCVGATPHTPLGPHISQRQHSFCVVRIGERLRAAEQRGVCVCVMGTSAHHHTAPPHHHWVGKEGSGPHSRAETSAVL